MDNEKNLSPQESLSIIQTMLQKAHRESYNESGNSAILWGAIVTFCGLFNAAEMYWNFYVGFDVWLLTLIAIIPQIFISISDNKNKKVKTYIEEFIDSVWIVYAVSIFALSAYNNIIPYTSEKIMTANNQQLFVKDLITGSTSSWHPFVPSIGSLYLIIFGVPTLITGLVVKFKPMIYGAVLNYIFFIISLYTPTIVDILLMGVSAIFCWLIPGIIRRREYLKTRVVPKNV